MPKLAPTNNRNLIRKLKKFGFEGPYPGGKHRFMLKNDIRLAIPNPHRNEISVDLLKRLLKQAGISVSDCLKKQ